MAGDQAHHAINVMRYREGDRIVIFDGRGSEHEAEIEQLSKKQLIARLLESRRVDRPLARSVTIVVALPKGDRQKFLVEKLVELGVTTLIPLATSRSVAAVNPKVIDRIEKHIIEASKQCGRNYLMQIGSPLSVSELSGGGADLTQALERSDAARESDALPTDATLKLLAHPYNAEGLSGVTAEPSQPVAIVIGPEGGFTDPEVASLIESGWQPVSLGPTILRIETAAMVAATIFGIGNLGR